MAVAAPRLPFAPHTYSGLAPRKLGFERYRIGETQETLGLPYAQALKRILDATRAHAGGRGWPEPIYTVGDEPKGEGIAASAALADAVRAAGGRTSVFTSIRDRDSPALPLLGHVDLIYLTLLALENAIARAGDTPKARSARRWLEQATENLDVDNRALVPPPLDDQALDAIRREAARLIAALGTED